MEPNDPQQETLASRIPTDPQQAHLAAPPAAHQQPAEETNRAGRLPYWPFWSPFAALGLSIPFFMVAGVGFFIVVGSYIDEGIGEELAGILVVACVVASVFVLGLVLPGGMSAARVGLTKMSWKRMLLWAAAAVLFVLAIEFVYSLITPGGSHQDRLIDEGDFSVAGILIIFSVVLVAPIVEEIFFRGVLFPALTKLTVVFGAVGSGAIFGVAHIGNTDIWGLIIIGVFGVVIAVLYWVTGSILPGMIVHAYVNAAAICEQLGLGFWSWVVGIVMFAIIPAIMRPFCKTAAPPLPLRRRRQPQIAS